MKWLIVAPFIENVDDKWLGAFVPGTNHTFQTVPVVPFGIMSGSREGLSGWMTHFKQAWNALRLAHRNGSTGLITVFPQLPVAAGLLAILFPHKVPLIAWTFNIGTLPTGFKRALSVLGMRKADAVIVHSKAEIQAYSEHFRIPRDRIIFVPLQRIIPAVYNTEDIANPYVISLGSANRDYKLLFEVLKANPVRTIVVASMASLEGLDIPPCVEVMSGLTLDRCHELLRGARVSVIPVANPTTASGQVTLLNSMGLGRATIITKCPGSMDYVVDGETAVLVAPGDLNEMGAALQRLWIDHEYRLRLGRAGQAHVARNYSDEAVAKIMSQVCDAVENGMPLQSCVPSS